MWFVQNNCVTAADDDVGSQTDDSSHKIVSVLSAFLVIRELTDIVANKMIYIKCNRNGWNDTMHYKIKQQHKENKSNQCNNQMF